MAHPGERGHPLEAAPWLRRLRAVTEEVRHPPASSPAERLRLGCELIAFAMNRLKEPAARRRYAVRDLLSCTRGRTNGCSVVAEPDPS